MSATHASRHLILVKHSLPHVEPGVPAPQWRLNDEGRARAVTLAAALRRYMPAQIATSDEPKAIETATLLAQHLPVIGEPTILHDLREHERRAGDFRAERAEFEAAVAAFFAQPNALVFGQETAAAARGRFERALRGLLSAQPHSNLIVVAHGTVISLFVAANAGLAPFPLWQQLGLPSFVVLRLPDLAHLTTVASVID